ncbi:MAG: hypothetical protein JWO36_4246 [Myxococcales bacterium]|nr:hypothetical protein [Myxococcales bacterium]
MDRIVGNYVLGPLIGHGGMGEVYAGEHRFLHDQVAIKLLRSHLSDDDAAIERFLAEAARTRSIAHRNIVRVLDFGRDEGSCYLVMERLEGESLAARLRRVNLMTELEVRSLGAAIADGMQAAHDAGIVHRDLKPANIMIVGDDQPKIVDFGIAKSFDGGSAVATGPRIGTPAYMAPEQLTANLVAPCVDVWALGAILFEAITGRLPFVDFAEGRSPQLFEAPPRPGELATISPALEAMLLACLDKDPGRRPASMTDIARTLRGADEAPERITQLVPPPQHVAAMQHASPPQPIAKQSRWPWLALPLALAGAVILTLSLTRSSSEHTAQPTISATNPPNPPSPTNPTARSANPSPPMSDDVIVPGAIRLEIMVRSAPSSAQIVVDGIRRGVTPATLVVPQSASIVVTRSGYQPSRLTVERAGPIDVRLVPVQHSTHVKRARAGETLD